MTQWHVVVHFLLAVILAAGFGIFSPLAVGTIFVILTVLVVLGAFAHRYQIKETEVDERARGGVRSAKMIKATPCVIICDPGREAGSEMAIALLRVLRDLGHLEPKALIANLLPQQDRARVLRRRLDAFGLHDVPVGVGTDGGVTKQSAASAEKLDPALSGNADRAASSENIHQGGRLLETAFDDAAPASLVLLCTSSLKVGGVV
jgi:hypothetical protein